MGQAIPTNGNFQDLIEEQYNEFYTDHMCAISEKGIQTKQPVLNELITKKRHGVIAR